MTEGNCSRCGSYSSQLIHIEHEYEDMNGHLVKEPWLICWSCDFDIINGRGELDDDAAEILADRAESDYEYDPLYYPKPSWIK